MTIGINAVQEVTSYVLTLSPDDATSLYSDIYRLLSLQGIDVASQRTAFKAPALYAVYDALYKAGVS